MTTPAITGHADHSTVFLSIPAPWAGAPDDPDAGSDAAADAALGGADVGAPQDPVALLIGAFWPWRRGVDRDDTDEHERKDR